MVNGGRSQEALWVLKWGKKFRWILHLYHTQSSLGPWKAFLLHFLPVLGAGNMTALYFAFFSFFFCLFSLWECSVLKCENPPLLISTSSQHHTLLWLTDALSQPCDTKVLWKHESIGQICFPGFFLKVTLGLWLMAPCAHPQSHCLLFYYWGL